MFSEAKPAQINFDTWPTVQALINCLRVVINNRCPARRNHIDTALTFFYFGIFTYGAYLFFQYPDPEYFFVQHIQPFFQWFVIIRLLAFWFTFKTTSVDVNENIIRIHKPFESIPLSFPCGFSVSKHRHSHRDNKFLKNAYHLIADSLSGPVVVADFDNHADAELCQMRLSSIVSVVKNQNSKLTNWETEWLE